jgi:uncharacterized protein
VTVPTYHAPGVYVEEVSSGARPIQAVGTSTAAFLGRAPAADAHVNAPFAVENWTRFCAEFVKGSTASTPLSHGVHGFFQNGGRRCYVVNVGDGPLKPGLEALKAIDEVAIVAAPGLTGVADYEDVLTHCEDLRDRVAVLDAPGEIVSVDLLTKVATVPPPKPRTPPPAADAPPAGPPTGHRPRLSKGGYGAVYWPWLVVRDPLAEKATDVIVPPSGYMAGIYARTDVTRGVHKAPANETVRGALGVSRLVTREEQGTLNQAGVNCIRQFPREGVLVWGARTLDDAASEWRYVNVRRLFNMVEESIGLSTRWVVFEPNDRTLWKSIERDIRAFLTLLWRDGALMGRTPDEAFFVQCDEETNPVEAIDAGIVTTRIGLAPVKPAEFVVFKIGQYQAGTSVAEGAGTNG